MSDDLMLPQVPEAKTEDPEDVSWALSTAEAMWARGDHSEGIKWVRRAAEAASEAENDSRALELAKAAADLAGMIARQTSNASIDLEEVEAAVPPPVPPARAAAKKPSGTPTPAKPLPTSVTKQVVTPSRPPAPLATSGSTPPPPKNKPIGTTPAGGSAPALVSKPTSVKPAAPGKKTSRKSRENLEAEARTALQGSDGAIAPEPVTAKRLPADTAETVAVQVPHRRRSRPDAGSNDPTIVGHVNELVSQGATAEWEAKSPDGDRKTAASPPNFKATMHSTPRSAPASGSSPPATVAGAMLTHGPTGGVGSKAGGRTAPTEQHDPGITTTQAVRVVVWRDNGRVHVAPAGTVVSAITVDAVLVALEPSADLTAWLSAEGNGTRRG